MRLHLYYIAALIASIGVSVYLTLYANRQDVPSDFRRASFWLGGSPIFAAQGAYSLSTTRDNGAVIQALLERSNYIIHGWSAQQVADDVHVVSCTWEQNGTVTGYHFEVNDNVQTVRQIVPGSELWRQYEYYINPPDIDDWLRELNSQ